MDRHKVPQFAAGKAAPGEPGTETADSDL